jgi:malonyl-CoA O-methyltransferase
MQQQDDHNDAFDKRQVRNSFERAADTYDECAVLQCEVGERLLERLDYIRHVPGMIMDVGAGTGYCTDALLKRYRKAQVVALDLSVAMLKKTAARQPFYQRGRLRGLGRLRTLCADAEQLPLADASCDMLFSNLTLQWCNDLQQTFREFRRVLRPGGMLLFSTFGPDTLKELRASWSAADDYPHVSRFLDMHDIGDAMLQAGLAEPVMDMEYITLTYSDVRTLMRDLKDIGAHNAATDRNHGLTGKRQLQAMLGAYEDFRTAKGLLPATYEVIYGHAWVGESRAVSSSSQGVDVALPEKSGPGHRR